MINLPQKISNNSEEISHQLDAMKNAISPSSKKETGRTICIV
jgi:hypothetical protein